MKQYFSQDKVNTGRQIEMDIAKGLAIIFMVWCHTFRSLGGDTSTGVGMFIDSILGGPFAAPVFMVCMGVGICYSRNSDSKTMARRGLGLLGMGYGLNICRYVLPNLITYAFTSDASYVSDLLQEFMEVDILQFAGLTFMVIALFKKLHISKWWLLGFACALSVLGTFLKGIGTGITLLDLILGLLWKTQEYTYFTLFHWLIYPVVGLIAGEYLQRCIDKKAVYFKIMTILFPIGLVVELALIISGNGLLNASTEYFYMTILDAFFLVTFVFTWIGLCFFFSEKAKGLEYKSLKEMSRNINNIYCIHWVLIGIVLLVVNSFGIVLSIGVVILTLISLGLLVASSYMARVYAGMKNRRKTAK